MKYFILVFLIPILVPSCKRQYTCECIEERRGFIYQETTISVKEANKNNALAACQKEYYNENQQSTSVDGNVTCLIK